MPITPSKFDIAYEERVEKELEEVLPIIDKKLLSAQKRNPTILLGKRYADGTLDRVKAIYKEQGWAEIVEKCHDSESCLSFSRPGPNSSDNDDTINSIARFFLIACSVIWGILALHGSICFLNH